MTTKDKCYETTNTDFAAFLIHHGATLQTKKVAPGSNGKKKIIIVLEVPEGINLAVLEKTFITSEFVACNDIKRRLTTWVLKE